MKKSLAILILLIGIVVFMCITEDAFLKPFNIMNLLKRVPPVAILGIGAAFVIMTGGIDLSIGSVVGMLGCLLPFLLTVVRPIWPIWMAILTILALSILIGLVHGLLITKLKLQPFIVTLCGLLIYRGIVRIYTGEQNQNFEISVPDSATEDQQTFYEAAKSSIDTLRDVATYKIPLGFDKYSIPASFFLMLLFAATAIFLLNFTVFGRHLLATGRNETAAKFSGIQTDRVKIFAYIICSFCAGVGGLMWILESNGGEPDSMGSFAELFAIAAAVLGGCSLRGGEGSIFGVVIGAAIIPVILNAINLRGFSSSLEPAIIGTVILVTVLSEVFVKMINDFRKRREMLKT